MRGRQLIATALLTMSSSVCLHAGDDVVLHIAGSQSSDITMTSGSVLTFTPDGIKVGKADPVSFGALTFGMKRDAISRTVDVTPGTPSGDPLSVEVRLPDVNITYPDPEILGESSQDVSQATISIYGNYT